MRQIMDKMKLSFAVWICIFTSAIFCTVYTQELAHFNKTSSVDFKRDNLWAEIMPGEIQEHKAKGVKSRIDNGTSSAPIVRANEKEVKSQTSSWKLPTAARVGRVQLGEKTNESEADRTTQKPKLSPEVSSGDRGEDTPPLILNPLTTIPRQIIWDDLPVEIQCEAQGHPKPVFKWYWNDTPLGTSGNKVKSFLNGTLRLEKFTEDYNGKYKCTATNKHGEDVSVTFEIVRGFQSKSESKEEVTVVVKKWDKLNIACGETPVSIKATKRWYYTEETKQIFADERIGTDSEGTIHFAYTELRDSEIYFCGLVNTAGIKVYNPRRLVVQDASDTGDSGPVQEFITKNAKAIIDREFKMECFFSGKPAPKVTWKNNQNEAIPAGGSSFYEVEDFGRKLKIKKVRQEDEGTYTCRAENTVDVKEATITVNVTSPPMRTKDSLRSYTKPDKEDFVFPCKAAAASGESVDPSIWYRNGEMLTRENLVNKSRYSFNEDFTELTIKQLVKQVDTASYQCLVRNSEGELYMNGYLRVINSLEITRQPGDKIKVSSNNTEVFDITVLAKGDTCCAISIVYYFNGTQISEAALNTPPFRKNGRTGAVMFVPSSVSAEVLSDWMGEYRCDVSDRYQRKNVLFSIVAKETTPEPYVATADSSGLWWIGILCGVLAIIIVIVVVFVIYKSNYPGDTYQLEKTELKHNLNPEEDLLNQSFQEI